MAITIFGLFIAWVLSLFIKDEIAETPMETFDHNMLLQSIILAILLIVILGQLVYFFNLLRGFISNQKKQF
ncbi:hypothetical protein K1F50_02190 [Muricauda oceani]|uniref:Uncharacterized protein n=1 Tax=Flagellimonas oceani TaxID=2698672 RepID=A0A6G7J190_9FLAO|nr:hypothetical protein [Allomuricauda oceani]MBW8241593.1 hypothetical protein [Allomuricauda oceani]QII44420.1 hypothetical protein GVT53_06940 [Allomuricauda oceani]